jgi:hypothetical protein
MSFVALLRSPNALHARGAARRAAGYGALALLLTTTACAAELSAPEAPVAMGAAARTADEAPASEMPGAPPPMSPIPGGQAPQAPMPATAAAADPAVASRNAKESASETAPKGGVEQLIIFTAQLWLKAPTEEYRAVLDRLVDLAVEHGGYLAQQTNDSVSLRVPSARFRAAMRAMEKEGEVSRREVAAQDVTEEFHDLSVRLKSLLATRQRIEEFLQRAKSIEEVLRVEQELARLNGEIDRIEGRMRFLSSQASYSTITVRLEPKPKGAVTVVDNQPKVKPGPRTRPLPITWLNGMSVDSLLRLR